MTIYEILEKFPSDSSEQFLDYYTKIKSQFAEFNCMLAGGSIRRALNAEPLDSDIDLFFKTHGDFASLSGMMDSGKLDNRTNNRNFPALTNGNPLPLPIQCIGSVFYQTPWELIDSFDFTICQFAVDLTDDEIYIGTRSLYDIGRKRIVVHKIQYPVASLRRLIKYTKQGYYACQGCLAEMLKSGKQVN